MGMPVTVAVEDAEVSEGHLNSVFAYLTWVDDTFSTYKPTSEVSRLNRGELADDQYSQHLRTVLALCEQTRRETRGYFDSWRDGTCDPSGLVKGWAIYHAAQLLTDAGCRTYFVDAGGDVQLSGTRAGRLWRVGIRNPFNRHEQVKVLALTDCGVATSGTAIRGQHIYDPHYPDMPLAEIASLTVVGPNVYEADRFATAAFAMGREGIRFIAGLAGFEGYQIDMDARATYTSGFERYILRP
jgi:thiamine biosynthesis lipoprotein